MPPCDDIWSAFLRRDAAYDGRVIVGVMTTGIYCKPSCAARHPRRENVRFFGDGAAARAAGLRACLRCRPDDLGRDKQAVARAVELLTVAARDGADGAGTVSLAQLGAAVGYAPHHFLRLFRRATGVTPAAFSRALRARRAEAALQTEDQVTDAIFAAGYGAASRFYASTGDRLGMSPSVWRAGGAGVVIHWTQVETSLGPLFIAATDKGLCQIRFDSDADCLSAQFPNAQVQAGGDALNALAAQVVAQVEQPGRHRDLPMDVQGTAFQEAVWQALRAIPPGETRSYAQLALAIGRPNAVRAAGSACGANPLAVVIPCHRVTRGDGGLGGYAWGVARKKTLLAREAGGDADQITTEPGD